MSSGGGNQLTFVLSRCTDDLGHIECSDIFIATRKTDGKAKIE